MVVSNSRIDTTDFGAFAMGVVPADPLVAQIDQGRDKASDAEVVRLKGKYSFRRLLDDDDDEVEPARLPPREIEVALKKLEVLEQFGRIVARVGEASERAGVFLVPGAKEGEWTVIDGILNGGEKIVLEGEGKDLRLKLPDVGASGKKYWLEYRKLEERLETFPAYEKE
jgi:hypothetical protein